MPRLSQMALPEFPRAAVTAFLRERLPEHNINPAHADLITDLAVHAAERARRTLIETVESAPTLLIELSALHLALGLIELDARTIAAAIERAGGDKTIILQEGTTHS